MKNLKYYFQKAQKEKWAVGQFNFSTLEQFHGIVQAAKNLKSPVILGTSEGESKFFGIEEAAALRNTLRKTLRTSGQETPIFLNLDHGKSFEYLKMAMDAGYDMVHFDGSKLPLEDNIKITKQVAKYAKKKGVLIEGEIGRIATDASKIYQEKFEIKEELLTNSEESVKYIDKSKVDLLAVSIGNFHGIEASGQNPRLLLNKLAEIKKAIKNTFLVLHGGSGTPEEDIRQAVGLGIVKININTEIRLAFTQSLMSSLKDNPDGITPYKYLQNSVEAVQKIVEQKIKLFGSENKI